MIRRAKFWTRFMPLAIVAVIVGVWFLGEALPKINPAWLFIAFLAGFVTGVWVLTAIIKPLLKEGA